MERVVEELAERGFEVKRAGGQGDGVEEREVSRRDRRLGAVDADCRLPAAGGRGGRRHQRSLATRRPRGRGPGRSPAAGRVPDRRRRLQQRADRALRHPAPHAVSHRAGSRPSRCSPFRRMADADRDHVRGADSSSPHYCLRRTPPRSTSSSSRAPREAWTAISTTSSHASPGSARVGEPLRATWSRSATARSCWPRRACSTGHAAARRFPATRTVFAETFPEPRPGQARRCSFVHDGRMLTSEGGAKSYDVAMYLVDHLYGEPVAAPRRARPDHRLATRLRARCRPA